MPPRVVVGTRGSALARWQASRIVSLLREVDPDVDAEIAIVDSDGDLAPGEAIEKLGERGVFVRRLERALLAGTIDAAVHSLKDMPSAESPGLSLAAIPYRDDARDAVLSLEGWELDDLPRGATVATGSPRRRTMLLHARPDLEIVPVRGNVDTRVRQLAAGQFQALVLAIAGVERLEITSVEVRPLPTSRCLPAVGQGAMAVEVRSDDGSSARLFEPLTHPPTVACCTAERSFLRELGGGCLAPATAYARIDGGRLTLEAMAGSPDGRVVLWESETGPPEEADSIGTRLARRLRIGGADHLLARARGQ